jgi:hypothetical protein
MIPMSGSAVSGPTTTVVISDALDEGRKGLEQPYGRKEEQQDKRRWIPYATNLHE